ncbi:MAG: peptide-methionine (R)-S-oxide reductase [Henriciella sp.]|jgi:peptide-methionine (R)-S-oxide reductase|uniref:peptide-methionine (R)-S-oxide reductase MsrB n=1 Tax=Henriciella sp. TaxID=1968823 RepID=UPI000C10D5C9|nr:peptide-methionine (R)-S-oxide reductase MsrB [Henriciella sp.]MAN74073.1 peptide-methionine (R)-S-oxide reductase [Henriciella sp.]MBF34199.1 peptide-methionine (R)-S-oxide reductase [Hyphomonadaceae bacterium]MBK76608.1 peptide-methionine (R)-S-oxide reductase [Henriciella sp.]PHR74816.1 MAG: peptide-methionine (R)-S-oxide reductase [Henriciella sp.]|tara:strand:- start:390 stop:812 length:423 start_codon:yes stop_codon:yes gene_type:complete
MLPPKPADNFKRVSRSNEEWRELLTDEQFRVGVKDGTERAFSPGNHNDEKRDGLYHCVGCDTPLWSSEHKFDSGTGWPSFYKPVRDTAVETKTDFKMLMPRKECHCATCGLHMGHVFKDGPPPTGERWCINGVVLNFKPA